MFVRVYINVTADCAKTGPSFDFQWLVLDTAPLLLLLLLPALYIPLAVLRLTR